MHSFRRKATTPSISTPVMATAPSAPGLVLTNAASESVPFPIDASAPQLFLLVDEDDEISPDDGDLRPRKKRVVDGLERGGLSGR